MPGKYKQKWRRLATWKQGGRRRTRFVRRLDAAKCLHDHYGPLMNLLGETVIDLYEEIFVLRRKRHREQWIIMEFAMRLDQAISVVGGPEWDKIREVDVDPLELALVCCNVWLSLNDKHGRDYTELESIQLNLRRLAPKVAKQIKRETAFQALAFNYMIS